MPKDASGLLPIANNDDFPLNGRLNPAAANIPVFKKFLLLVIQ
jgi:hypothetical protein